MFFRLFPIAAIFMLSLSPVIAAAATGDEWCVPKNTPRVNVTTDSDPIKWNFGTSQKSLNGQHIDTINPYGKQVTTDVGGLMQGGIRLEEKLQFFSLQNPNTNQICSFFNVVEVSFRISPTIYIASEHKPGSCLHESIKQHEMKHINTDREIVNKYAAKIGADIRAEIMRKNVYGPVAVSNTAVLKQQMRVAMDRIMQDIQRKMDAERRQRQQAIDTLAEYERVNHACGRGL